MSGRATADVVVVGGGVIGLSIADVLAGEGVSVRLLEAEGLGQAASGAAAGMLAPVAEAHADDPLLALSLASLMRFDGLAQRLREETGIDVELEGEGSIVVDDADATGRVPARSSDADETGVVPARSSDVDETGVVPARPSDEGATRGVPARPSDAALAAAAKQAGWTGGPLRVPLPAEALDAPRRRLVSQGRSAFFAPAERHVRPPLLTRALAASARARGVRIETGARVERLVFAGDRLAGVESSSGRVDAGRVVVAAGPWTTVLLGASGLPPSARGSCAIEPVRGQILELLPVAPLPRAMLRARGIYLVPKRDGSCIVGATEERRGFERRVTAGGLAWLLERAAAVWPELEQASFVRAWAGLRPVSPDGRPWIGAWPGPPGLVVAAGHGRNGVLLAPITAALVADAILGRPVSALAHACRVD
ncbi:MAG: FAD-dependent oxidoreductase [Spirochaetaceae bacterium]|nr:FAD-dependent oxidoreductase [Myxococcales bacterium]MCB9723557.1 FAD-dependent oxidoreductase [Spirochaetaceae bacterium]